MLPERVEYVPCLAAKVVWQETWGIGGAGEAPQIRDSGADRGRFEASCVGDNPTGHEPAVAPAHDGCAIGIGDAHRNYAIDPGHIILIILSTPIAHIRKAELFAVAAGAPRIRTQD